MKNLKISLRKNIRRYLGQITRKTRPYASFAILSTAKMRRARGRLMILGLLQIGRSPQKRENLAKQSVSCSIKLIGAAATPRHLNGNSLSWLEKRAVMYIWIPEDTGQVVDRPVRSRISSGTTLGQPRAAKKIPPDPIRFFTCSADDRKKIAKVVGKAVSEEELRNALSAAVKKALALTLNAARELERSPRSTGTKTLFREIFGTLPEFVPSWRAAGAIWKDRGGLVALRLGRAAKILAEGDIRFYCWGCPGGDRPPETYEACNFPPGKYIIGLGKGFWENLKNPSSATNYMAMTLLHEALHVYFSSVITAKHEGRYGNAYCYQRFVPEINGLDLYPETEKACASILRRGARGPEVRKLQGFLNNWIKQFPGPDKPAQLTVNGVFDLSTETAVRKVQSAANLKEKGVVGSETWQELLKWK